MSFLGISGIGWCFRKANDCMVCSRGCKMSILHRLVGGGDDGPGWCGGYGCSCSDVSILPEDTTNIKYEGDIRTLFAWMNLTDLNF